MSVSSVPQSPTQNFLVTSPLLQASLAHQIDHRRLSLSPPFSLSRRSSVSSDSTRSPRSNKTQPHANITHLNLDMSRPQEITAVSNVEDSPQLLATSLGGDLGGRLVPSISNISLLSLNQQHNQILQPTTELDTIDVTYNPHDTSSSRFNNSSHRPFNLQRVPSMQHAQFTIGSSRKSSFNSPTLQSSQLFNNQARNIRRSSTNIYQQQQQQQQTQSQVQIQSTSQPLQIQPQQFSYKVLQTKQPIQIRQKRGSIDEIIDEPDSPSLGPVSLAGSPSNFLLSHSSPPNSFKSSSLLSNLAQQPISRYPNNRSTSRHQPSQIKLLLNKLPENELSLSIQQPSIPLSRADSLTDSIGGHSPELAPVSTTLPPMTPLALSIPHELSSRSNSNVLIDDDDDDDDIDSTPANDNNTANNSTYFDNSQPIDDNENDDIFGENIDD